jgi:hypothetical protein
MDERTVTKAQAGAAQRAVGRRGVARKRGREALTAGEAIVCCTRR